MNHYITRCQSILQSGLPDNELLVYWPLPDYWMNSFNQNPQLEISTIDRWLHPSSFYKCVKALQSDGYSLDFVSDDLLNNLTVSNGALLTRSGSAYKTLIFPPVEYLPEATFQHALEFARQGALVIFGNLPGDVPGYANLTERRFCQPVKVPEKSSFLRTLPKRSVKRIFFPNPFPCQDLSSSKGFPEKGYTITW
jgi:hypothetical protein